MRCNVEEIAEKVDPADALFIGALLAILQAMDGLLTSLGVARFGSSVEGNPLLRVLFDQYGCVPTLAIFKTMAILSVVTLTCVAKELPWVKQMMEAMSCFYLIVAVIPWAYILFIKLPA